MAADGYLLVQWRRDGTWFAGYEFGAPSWTHNRKRAKRFDTIKSFRAYDREMCGGVYVPWTNWQLRFVRVRPRKEAA
jgi:hypothetical protein